MAGGKRVQDNLHAHAQNEPIKYYQVPTPLLASMCRALPMPIVNANFSSRSEKKYIFFDVDIVVKQHKNIKGKCGLSWSVLFSTTSTHHCSYTFPKQKVFERKADAYK